MEREQLIVAPSSRQLRICSFSLVGRTAGIIEYCSTYVLHDWRGAVFVPISHPMIISPIAVSTPIKELNTKMGPPVPLIWF